MLVRHHIAQTGRYYDDLRTIVVRSGMTIEQERRVLWHEIHHADRRDTQGHNSPEVERLVDRQAAENAMPWVSVLWAWREADDLAEMAGLLKLPEDWVRARLRTLHPARRAQLEAEREGGSDSWSC